MNQDTPLSEPVVTTRSQADILIVTINRPYARNAVDRATAGILYETFQTFEADEEHKVAILTGADNTFCAGADLKSIAADEQRADLSDAGLDTLAPMGPTRLRLSKPLVAAVEGHAVAGGMELALWCDLRIVAEDAVFGIFCRRFGVPLVDLGTIRLPRLIGHSRAMDLILTGRSVDANEALAMGLANRMVRRGEALTEALALAKSIAAFPQTCMRGDRMSALEQWDFSEEDAIANELRHGRTSAKSGETRMGTARFTQGKGRHGSFDER